jgi:hypothetical protein
MGIFSTGTGKTNKLAAAAEATRQKQIDSSTGRINAIFDDPQRGAQRQNFLEALRGQYQDVIGRQQGDAQRRLKFALARSGQTAGSVDVDSNRRLQDDRTRALLNAEGNAQGAFADLLGQDEAARSNLIGMARSGADTSTAAARAAQSMQASIGKANRGLGAETFADAFSSTGENYKRMEENAERRRGMTSVWS